MKRISEQLRIQLSATCWIVGATMLSGAGCLLTDFVNADVIDDIDITVPLSCTMSSGADSTAHTASSISGGRYESDIGTTNFLVTCSDSNGYAIYAVGYSGDTEGNTGLVAASPLTSDYNIVTGTATTGSASNWAMKITTGNDSATVGDGYSSYAAVPLTYAKVAYKNSAASSNNALAITSTYRVFIADSQPVGSYVGKVKYTVVNPSTQDCPGGYELSGGVCVLSKFDGITTMQAMTTSICTNAAVGDTKQLKDTRDNKYYWVTKLADNKCWMTQNLDLDLSSSVTLTPDDTNITDDWTPASTATTVVKTNLSTSNWAAIGNATHPYSFDGGDAYLPDGVLSSECTNADITTCSGAVTLSLTDTTAVLNNTNAHYHVGNLYTWTAAIASDNSSSHTTRYTNASSSICPKGWKLPSIFDGSNSVEGDFVNLYDEYSSIYNSDSALLAAPLYFVRSGWVTSAYGSLGAVGSYGQHWSSTVVSSDYAYNLSFCSTSVARANATYRSFGFSIRCLAK